jgi:conjugal transfer mating pair stabilization protein TraN
VTVPGSAKRPNCAGIPVGRLAQVDWNRVDLSEWLAILSQTGRLPTVDNASLDRLTGSGSVLNTDGNREEW